MKKFASAFVALAAALPVAAQTIYRCGSEYSQSPCEGARLIEPEGAPREGEARAAREQARRNAALAGKLERERVAAEEKVAGPSVVVTGQQVVSTHASPKADKGAAKGSKGPAQFRASTAPHPNPKPKSKPSGG